VHAEAPLALYWPLAQRLVTADRPVVAQKLPAEHASQLDWPLDVWYVEALQAVHALAPAEEYWPAGQRLVAMDRPVVAQ
jgi:hypothetical protein